MGVFGDPGAKTTGSRPGDRGAAVVEFALVVTLLFGIIFGLIEGGLWVRASNSMRNVADDAARRGAIMGGSANADWAILRQIQDRADFAAASLDYVVVYRASSGTAGPSDACQAGTPVAGECNVYVGADFALDESAFDCSNPALDGSWCPDERVGDPTDFAYVGIWIEATHTGIVGLDVDLRASSVSAIEGTGGA